MTISELITALAAIVTAGAALVNLLLIGALVSVTIWYARSTKKMAKEMERQRQDSFRPIIVFAKKDEMGTETPGRTYQESLQETQVLKEPSFTPTKMEIFNLGSGIEVSISNIGPGPAMNVRGRIEPPNVFTEFSTPALGPGDARQCSMSELRVGTDVKPARLVVSYEDVFGRPWNTVAELEENATPVGRFYRLVRISIDAAKKEGQP